jgi:hypothetical protein
MNSCDIDMYAIDQSRGNYTDFFTQHERTSCFGHHVFFILVCDFLWFTEGLFWHPTNHKKHFCLNDIAFSVMTRLTESQRLPAIGMLQARLALNIVARHFGVHRNTIQSLLRHLRRFGNTRNRQRLDCPSVTSRQQDYHIWLMQRRGRWQTSQVSLQEHPRITTNQL